MNFKLKLLAAEHAIMDFNNYIFYLSSRFPSQNILLNCFSLNVNGQRMCHADSSQGKAFDFLSLSYQYKCVVTYDMIYYLSDCETENKVKEQRVTSSRKIYRFHKMLIGKLFIQN